MYRFLFFGVGAVSSFVSVTPAYAESAEKVPSPEVEGETKPAPAAGSSARVPSGEKRPESDVSRGRPPSESRTGFTFGSYGRVTAASDLRGGSGRPANIVAYGPRFDLPSYAELQLDRYDHFVKDGDDITTHVVSTIAFASPLFHETGKFSADVAVRNLYAETKGIFAKGFSVWAGSRMYRGDDIYLLNWWPLDNLNTVGGGVRLALDTTSNEATVVALQVGLGRALDPFSYQTRLSPSPTGFGATDVVTLDRARMVSSLKLSHVELFNKSGGVSAGIKAVLYGEYHSMSNGVRTTESNREEELLAEQGSIIGAQIGAFTGERDGFVNLFLRYATGIAAYGDKTTPSALAKDRTASAARELLVALSANYESGPFGVMIGGYIRGFKDASGITTSRTTFREGSIVVRPQVWFGQHAGLAIEGSYQAVATAGVDELGAPERASLTRLAFVPFITPAGRGSFTRPHFQLIYAYTARDSGAQRRYPIDDKFYLRKNEHFLGLGVEWWFNSSYR